jgi:hypothetical protein
VPSFNSTTKTVSTNAHEDAAANNNSIDNSTLLNINIKKRVLLFLCSHRVEHIIPIVAFLFFFLQNKYFLMKN